jgi:hypothetical protein
MLCFLSRIIVISSHPPYRPEVLDRGVDLQPIMAVRAQGLRVEVFMLDVNVALVDCAADVRGWAFSHKVAQVITEGAAVLYPLSLSNLSCSSRGPLAFLPNQGCWCR